MIWIFGGVVTRETFVLKEYRGLKMLESPSLDLPWLLHAFTTRLGGVSEGPFSSLNLGYTVGDLPERVAANRKRLADALGYDLKRTVSGQQVHGTNVAVVSLRDAGAGALKPESSIPAADGLITSAPRLPLTAFFADCVPVYLVDTAKRAVAIVHAGWRGTVRRVASRTVARMSAAFGTRPADCIAVIGPAVGPCCYTVDAPVAREFQGWGREVSWQDGNRWRVDLREANRRDLLAAGVFPEKITVVDFCTACHPELMFSYRRDGSKTGRMAAVVMIR
ncbi:MAG TPA: peptidoglycan editing factor PgeF [Desulfotomaculum sp.]|nr:peptidoglycan editing factor PgeF [Desulfotomaculum sp.]